MDEGSLDPDTIHLEGGGLVESIGKLDFQASVPLRDIKLKTVDGLTKGPSTVPPEPVCVFEPEATSGGKRRVWLPGDNQVGEDDLEPEKPDFRRKTFNRTDELSHRFNQANRRMKEKLQNKRLAPYMQIPATQIKFHPNKKRKVAVKSQSPKPPPPPPQKQANFQRKARHEAAAGTGFDFQRKMSEPMLEREHVRASRHKQHNTGDDSVSLDGSYQYNEEYGMNFVVRRHAQPPKPVKVRESKPRPKLGELLELPQKQSRRKEIDFFVKGGSKTPGAVVEQGDGLNLFSRRFMATHMPKHNDSDHNTVFTDVSEITRRGAAGYQTVGSLSPRVKYKSESPRKQSQEYVELDSEEEEFKGILGAIAR